MKSKGLVLVLLLGLGLRLYNLPINLHYTGDEGRDVLVFLDMLTLRSFPLRGPSSSVGDLYLGPAYYYLAAPFLGLAFLNPIGPALLVVFLSTLSIYLIYKFSYFIFQDRRVALYAALIYAVSPSAVEFGRFSWNPNIMPFFTLLFYFSILKYLKSKNTKWAASSGVSLGVMLQSHYLALIAIPTLLLLVWANKPKLLEKKGIVNFLLSFVAVSLPLFIYEIVSKFANSRGFYKLIFSEKAAGVGFPVDVSINALARLGSDLFYIKNPLLALAVVIIAFVIWIRTTEKSEGRTALLSWLIVGIFFSGFFSGKIQSHYLEYFWPIVVIIVAKSIYKYRLAALLLTANMLYGSFIFLNTRPAVRIAEIKAAVEIIERQSRGERFNFALVADSNYDSSYRYFFRLDNAKAEYEDATQLMYVVCETAGECEFRGNPKWEIAVFEVEYNGQVEVAGRWQVGDNLKIVEVRPDL